jgi:hypothetical protein
MRTDYSMWLDLLFLLNVDAGKNGQRMQRLPAQTGA